MRMCLMPGVLGALLAACTAARSDEDAESTDGGALDGGSTDGGATDGGATAGEHPCSPFLPLEETGATWRYDYAHPQTWWWGSYEMVATGPDERDGDPVWTLAEARAWTWQWDGKDERDQVSQLECRAGGWYLLATQGTWWTLSKMGFETSGTYGATYLEPPLVAPRTIAVGEAWTAVWSAEEYSDSHVRTVHGTRSYAVVGADEITVPAGTWEAFVVDVVEGEDAWTEHWVEGLGVVSGRYTTLLSFGIEASTGTTDPPDTGA